MAKLYFFYGPMTAGKSTALLQAADNYTRQGGSCLLLTTSLDTRHGQGLITSRLGLQAHAQLYHPDTQLIPLISPWIQQNSLTPNKAILIDEAQFLSYPQVLDLHAIAHTLNIPVLAYGLLSTYKLTPFLGSSALLALADTLTELKTICSCGKKATLNILHSSDGSPILEGSDVNIENPSNPTRYRALCADCFYSLPHHV